MEGVIILLKEHIIEFAIENWELPFCLEKGMILKWNSSSIEVIEILSVEFKDQVADAKLLIKLT